MQQIWNSNLSKRIKRGRSARRREAAVREAMEKRNVEENIWEHQELWYLGCETFDFN